jgi:hypothetical protein
LQPQWIFEPPCTAEVAAARVEETTADLGLLGAVFSDPVVNLDFEVVEAASDEIRQLAEFLIDDFGEKEDELRAQALELGLASEGLFHELCWSVATAMLER